MANRIIEATLYQYNPPSGSSNPTAYLLNVSPRTLELFNNGDAIYLVVKAGAGVTTTPTSSITCEISWNSGSTNPFSSGPSNFPTAFNNVASLGTLSNVTNDTSIRYTLTVNFGGQQYVEDPKMQIDA